MDVQYYVTQCCGIVELVGVSEGFNNDDEYDEDWDPVNTDPKKALAYVHDSAFSPNVAWRKPAHILFSDVNDTERENYRGGRSLVRLIRRHRLGTVVKTKPAHNSNSGNTVVAWLWTPDWGRVKTKAWE